MISLYNGTLQILTLGVCNEYICEEGKIVILPMIISNKDVILRYT